jgi:hypothetical protein
MRSQALSCALRRSQALSCALRRSQALSGALMRSQALSGAHRRSQALTGARRIKGYKPTVALYCDVGGCGVCPIQVAGDRA